MSSTSTVERSSATSSPTSAKSFRPGTYQKFEGTIYKRAEFTVGDASFPAGAWMQFTAPVMVNGKKFARAFLEGCLMAAGHNRRISARLDVRPYRANGATHQFLKLSGVTDMTQLEPTFDGEHFFSHGKQLDTARISGPPELPDAPANVLVFDTESAKRKIFILSEAALDSEDDDFEGFAESVVINTPSDIDAFAVTLGADARVYYQSGRRHLSDLGSGWYYDGPSRTLYQFGNGKLIGVAHLRVGNLPTDRLAIPGGVYQ